VIAEEFLTIAGRALRDHRGADSVEVQAIEPSIHGPRVRWTGPILARTRQRDPYPEGGFKIGPVPGPVILDLLSLATAFRWELGPPRCDQDWSDRLARRYRKIFGPAGPATGPGWCWLWEAGAQSIKEIGIPGNFRTTDTKEKFGSARWYAEGEIPEAVHDVIDAVEHLSAYVCEDCGAPGRLRQGGWVRTLCERHAGGRKPAGD
jgi:hypothetical protein